MTDPLTDERIAHDLALAEEASPRPWCKSYTYQAIRHVQRNCDLDCPQHPEYADECPQFGKNDGPFIAAIAESGPVALREVRRLREALGNTRTIAKQHSKGGPLAGAYQWFMQELDKALEGAKDD